MKNNHDTSTIETNTVNNQTNYTTNKLMTLNKEQQLVFDYVFTTKENVFVHGGPGVGKSHTINTIVEFYPSEKIKIVASTGINTINRLSKNPFGFMFRHK